MASHPRRQAAGLLPSLAALVVAATLAACSGSPVATATPSAGPSGPPVPTPSPSTSPSLSADPSANAAVVRIDDTGGMLPPWITLDWYPSLVLYADGRMISEGPVDAIYPGAALPNLQVTQLSRNGVAQVLRWAAEAGLAGPNRELGQPMLDAGTTNVTVVRDGVPHVTRIWDINGDEAAIGAVRQFRDVLLDIRGWLPAEVAPQDVPYAWDRLRIVAEPRQPDEMPDEPNLREWPLPDQPLATIGVSIDGEGNGYRCALIEGDDLDVLRPDLLTANELTLWRSTEQSFGLVLDPLLPDDEGCPGL